MSKQNIPAVIVTRCDCCGRTDAGSDSKPTTFRHAARLHFKQPALDYSGAPVASADIEMDVCDACMFKVDGVLRGLAFKPAT